MAWGRIDDKLHLNHKVSKLFDGPCPLEAMGVWVLTASLSADTLSDGVVTTGQIRQRCFPQLAVDELVRVGLWRVVDGGYQFHDWADYNPTAERVEEKKRLAIERKAKHRQKLAAPKRSNAQQTLPLSDVPPQERVLVPQERDLERGVERSCRLWDLGSGISSSDSEIPEQPSCQPPPNVVPIRKSSPPPRPDYNSKDLEGDFSRLRVEAKLGRFKAQRTDYDALQHVISWAYDERPTDPRSVAQAAISNFLNFASDWEIKRRYKFKDFAEDPGSWLAATTKPNSKRSDDVIAPTPYRRAVPFTNDAALGGE